MMSRPLVVCEFPSNTAIVAASMMPQSSAEYTVNNVVGPRYALAVQSGETAAASILPLMPLPSEYIKKSFMMLRSTDALCSFAAVSLLSAMFIVDGLHHDEAEYEVICFRSLTNIFVRLSSLMINSSSGLKVLFLSFERVSMILR